MIYLKLDVSYISLSSVSFKIIDPNNLPSNFSIIKDDVSLTLNDKPFVDFALKTDPSNIGLYTIIPDTDFLTSDNLYIQIKTPSFTSNKLKVLFCKKFSDGKTKIPFNFSKYDPNENSYIFTLTSINDIPFNLSTKPITVSNPIDNSKSEIIPIKLNYTSGEIINTTVRLIDIYNKPVPNGLYQIELHYTDAI